MPADLLERSLLEEPRLRDAILRPGRPGPCDEIAELVVVDPCGVADPHENRPVPVPVGRREEDGRLVSSAHSSERTMGAAPSFS